MKFSTPLVPAILIRRYKRFLADVLLDNGDEITVHCPNSGSMKSCAEEGWRVLLSKSSNPGRKYPYTWEMVHNGKCWIGINTGIPNVIVAEAIHEHSIMDLTGYEELKREVKYGANSRIDILLSSGNKKCYIEVKNVTLVEKDGNYYFPDAVTERGTKHLSELSNMVNLGFRSVMFYVVQRNDGKIFRPASHIDPNYSQALKQAIIHGVEIMVYRADVRPDSITLAEPVACQI